MREYMLKEGNWEEVNRNKEGKDGDEKNKLDKIERSKKYENDSEKKGMIQRVCDKLDAFKDKITNKENKEENEKNEKNKNDSGENEKAENALNSSEQKRKQYIDSLKVENYEKNNNDSPDKKDSSEEENNDSSTEDGSGEKGNQGRAIYDDGR